MAWIWKELFESGRMRYRINSCPEVIGVRVFFFNVLSDPALI